ncbi:MAG: hypothetical protein JXR40_02690, partial [Pontiellaceae bacterium]|nr:hypothetical protein [Pontiellaceae bacterium]
MKRVVCALCFALLSVSAMAISDLRTWEAADGKSSLYASMEKAEEGQVVLRTKDGRKVSVPIDKLSPADQKYIEENTEELSGDGSSTASAESSKFPYEQGVVVGPIEAASDSHYLLYLPTTLEPDQKVPLLFFTHSGGGSSYLLEQIKEGAELTGWIMAISVES